MIKSFEPIIDSNSKILILGTMPSVKSLQKNEYYGNKQNQFWKIVYKLFGEEVDENYDNKKKFLIKNHIALWDVLKKCDREGSSDTKIKNPVVNDFESVLNKYPNIKAIYFNGAKAEQLFKRLVLNDLNNKEKYSFCRLPSTSPAHAVKLIIKLEQWEDILKRFT